MYTTVHTRIETFCLIVVGVVGHAIGLRVFDGAMVSEQLAQNGVRRGLIAHDDGLRQTAGPWPLLS